MPRLRKPESAIDLLVFLKKAAETATNNHENGESYLSSEIIERTTRFTPKLETGMGKLGNFESIWQKEIREKNQALSIVKIYIRDLWEGLRRRVYRENLPLDVFAYYKLPKSGNNPILNTEGQWLETAKLIVEGEADALAAGYAPMTNPSVAELQEKLIVARTEAKDVSEADKQLDQAQEGVSELIPEAKIITNHIIAELEFNLYEKDDASKRRIMRNYGVRYQLTKNEQSEDESDMIIE